MEIEISVIIPNYNHQQYLKERIESALNQSYRNFEVIILDDCSTDHSKDIIEEYRTHPKVTQIIYNPFNSGSTFIQWKKGIDVSNGKYIWIAESDDIADTQFLMNLLPEIESDPLIGLVYCDANEINEVGEPTGFIFSEYKNKEINTNRWSTNYIIEGKEELKLCLSKFCSINNVSSVLFRKDCLQKLNLPNTTYKYAGDWFTYINIALKYKIAYNSLILNHYRNHSNNASKKGNVNNSLLYEEIEIYKLILLAGIYNFKDELKYKEFVREKIKKQDPKIKKADLKMFRSTKDLILTNILNNWSLIKRKAKKNLFWKIY